MGRQLLVNVMAEGEERVIILNVFKEDNEKYVMEVCSLRKVDEGIFFN